jgi:hypothetical protein
MLVNMLKAKSGFTAIALLGLSALASDAGASAGGTIPGLSCLKVGSTGSLGMTADGALTNNSTTDSLTVECPMPWDFTDLGSHTGSFQFEYVDSSPTANVSCTVRAEALTSNSVSQANFTSSGINDNGWRFGSAAVSPTDGAVHVRCVIPPRESATNENSFLVTLKANQP